jgi:hypothetical protein
LTLVSAAVGQIRLTAGTMGLRELGVPLARSES